MKVAISAEGSTPDSRVDTRFGRAKYFVIADTETGDFKAVDNEQTLNVPQGAGIQSAQTVAQSGASAVISGHVGPKAFRALNAAGIDVLLASDMTVAQALDKFSRGELEKVSAPDVEGHWI